MTLTWTKNGDFYNASHGDVSLLIHKTYSSPKQPIPRAEKWTLSIGGQWYACVCKPTRKACYEAAERFLEALDVLEPKR
jgi:hypothetical protein